MFTLLLAAAAAASVPQATPIDIGSWFSSDDYPAEALKKGVQGKVTFEVDVDPEGKPTACRVSQSSGSPILDKATCDLVLSKGKFQPATLGGKPVAGTFSKSTFWRLAEGVPGGSGYAATIIDFSSDPPTCTIDSKGNMRGPTCEQSLKDLGPISGRLRPNKVVLLISASSGDETPYRGQSEWGPRVSFVATDLYAVKNSGQVACKLVASEGISGANPCEKYPDANSLSEEQKRNATRLHLQESLFVVMRPESSQRKCKGGESAAEILGCV